ncbi:hypothetical protein MP638_006800 [Amoeboaphelidium occidentale]|nr:hypothetical protein MP638_006800 [Amoeboaphelidium occidentale]
MEQEYEIISEEECVTMSGVRSVEVPMHEHEIAAQTPADIASPTLETESEKDKAKIKALETLVAQLAVRLEETMKLLPQTSTNSSKATSTADIVSACEHGGNDRNAVPLCCLFDAKNGIGWGSYQIPVIKTTIERLAIDRVVPCIRPMTFTDNSASECGWYSAVSVFIHSPFAGLSGALRKIENVDPSDSIWDLRKRAAQELAIPTSQFELSLNGCKLRDEHMVAMYPIVEGTVLTLTLLPKAACYAKFD